MIVHRHSQRAFGKVLTDYVFVQPCLDFFGLGQGKTIALLSYVADGVGVDDFLTKFYAFVTDTCTCRPRKHLFYLVLAFSAKKRSLGIFAPKDRSLFTDSI